ncbi:Reticulocyte-binding protein 2 like protein [Termitomyces sp. T112]|nr:Reticulocyte-binding protein 2 like protein [Termitomyces sp. T112]
MTTLTSPTPISLHDAVGAELEPDKAWKDALRAKIEDGLSSMVEDAKKNYHSELGKETLPDARRESIIREFNETMNNMRKLAQDTFLVELERERQERRWAAGVNMIPSWNEALVQEQQDIMNRIKGTRKDNQSPSAEQSSSVRPTDDRPVVELSSSSSGPLFSLHVQNGPMTQQPVEERRERSLSGMERLEQGHGSLSIAQSPQPPSDPPVTPEQQKEQEEKARRILERKERERREWERQEKADQEKERLRKEKEEEMVEKLKEQERARKEEKQLLERKRVEKERQDRERSEKQRRESERAEKERVEKKRQLEKEILEKQRLETEKQKERQEKEKREKEEREEERKEGERRERERQEEERERQRQEKERQERERQEKEHARLDRERWEKEHLAKLEAAREKEEREEKERLQREEEETRKREKAREPQRQRDGHREYVQGVRETEAHDRLQPQLDRNSPESTEFDFSDAYNIDDLELLSPPPTHSTPVRKQSIHEWLGDSTINRSINNSSRLSPSDRCTARSPPIVWKPSSVEDDVTAKPFLTELGRRNSVTSIKSTGSVGVRPSIVDEPIPERSDSETEYMDENARAMEPEDWSSSKPWEKEKRREHWKSSAGDGPRSDESHAPQFLNLRTSYRAEDTKPLPPRDRYDSEQNYRGLRYHRSEEIPNRPPISVRAPLRREASFHEEYDDVYQPHPLSRSIRARTSFEDRGGPYASFQPSSQGRVPSRPSSTLNDERDYHDQASYRLYPTPPNSANRSSIRDHLAPSGRYSSGLSYGYSSEPRSNTLKYAQQSESSLSRRPSENRPNLNRGPSFTQNYSEEPSPLHASPSESYSRTYERAASASIPISVRQHRPSYGSEETDGWRSWSADPPLLRRESRRESERRDRYDQDRDEFQDTEYSSRSGREYEVWHPDPYYGPHPEPLRRKGYPMRSPMASHPSSYHDGPDYSFGGRDRTYESLYDNDEFMDDMETDMAPNPRYRDIPRQRREDIQRSLDQEERNRREAEDWRRQMAEEEVERRRQADERMRFAFEEEEAQRRETKQEAKRKEAKRQATEARLEDETWQREEALRRQAENARKATAEAMKIAQEVRIQAEEAKRKEEEAIRKEEEVLKRAREAKKKEEEVRRQAEEARRKEEEAKLKEEEAKKKEEEARRKEEEVRRQAEEARRKEVAAREEARRVREENWKREQEMKFREEELKKREEELQRREREIEAERLQKEVEKSRKEAERLQKKLEEEEKQRQLEEQRKREERFRYEQQQEEFRRREQEIHERKRQDSMGGSFPSSYTSSSSFPARSYPSPSATSINGQTPSWSSSPKPNAASKASSASTASKSRSGSMNMNASFPTSTPSPHPSPAFDEAEFKRKQEEFSQQQQEKFRKEQLRFEETRQRTESNKMSPEQVLSILERHERQWNILISSTTSLHWGSIPWPMFFPPQSPEDITLSAVTTYLQSPLLPDREKAKPQKDRLKEMIKKWHPDRFETKYLPRIIEGDLERVKEGTGVVIRLLNELLTKVNTPGLFGSP